tara:strand:- start:1154 stop:1552 length:399 start_codon:yes stop_codon:yes gene_type:complete
MVSVSAGSFSCQPAAGPIVPAGQAVSVNLTGPAFSSYFLAADLASPTACATIPGFTNALIVVNQPIVLQAGFMILGPQPSSSCGLVGLPASYSLSLPTTTPSGISFRFQALFIPPAQQAQPLFTGAVQVVTG